MWFGLGIVGLIIWITIAFWPARVAGRKGHSFIGYFLLSLLFLPTRTGHGVRGAGPKRQVLERGERRAARVVADESWERRVETVVRSLDARLGVALETKLIRTEVEAGFATYATARIREFVPILVESKVRARFLNGIAIDDSPIPT